MATDVDRQRDYYARTAGHYDAMHVRATDEHGVALAMFVGLARELGTASVLDVGAGTGRGIEFLRRNLDGARVVGVEPVGELREVGHARGIPEDMLVDGDATALDFADGSFDFVIETGVLHHVPDPARAVAEMLRVARHGVMISDANKFGQGSAVVRLAKAAIGGLGLWNTMIRLTNRGALAKWSEGDGLFYSYSVFDNVAAIRGKFPRLIMTNTLPCQGYDLRRGSPQMCVIALRA